MSTPKSVIELAKKTGAKMMDIKFVDTFGTWQHFSCPIRELTEEIFTDGLGFDGSSIRGWKSIEASDMLAMPDPATAFIDPFCAVPTLSLTCTIAETGTKEPTPATRAASPSAPRNTSISTGLADPAFFGPEAEFFIFDNVQFDSQEQRHLLQRGLARRPSGTPAAMRCPTWATRSATRKDISRSPPADTQQDIRTEMCLVMEELGVRIEKQHHEVATAGQAEIDYPVRHAGQDGRRHDGLQVRGQERGREARQDGDLHAQAPLWRQRQRDAHPPEPLEEGQAPVRRQRIRRPEPRWRCTTSGGLLKHAHALCAICSPTTNSYKRLVPGYEAPVNLAYSSRNRSAAIRIPTYSENPKAKRLEYRPPDPAANPYLAFAAMLMAGLDGVLNKIDPGEPLDKNIYELPPEELTKVPHVPGSLGEAIVIAWRRTTSSCSKATCSPGLPGHVDSDQAQGARRPALAPASV